MGAREHARIGVPFVGVKAIRRQQQTDRPDRKTNAQVVCSRQLQRHLSKQPRMPSRRDNPTADVDDSYVLEIRRQAAGGSAHHNFCFGVEGYSLRGHDGHVRNFDLDWSQELLDELRALQTDPRPETIAQKLGATLRTAIAAADWGREEAAIFAAARHGRGVSLTVRLGAAELYAFPWELLTHPSTGQHLADLDNVLIRYAWPGTTTTPASRECTCDQPGRIVMAWSGAGGVVPAAEHEKAISAAVADARDARFEFEPARDIVSEASRQALLDTLDDRQRPVAILHLLCHGIAVDGRFGLCLSGAPGKPDIVDASQLRRILGRRAASLRLVVLSACDGADMGEFGNHLGGIAQSLHRVGIECVIASRFQLSSVGSITFARTFYRAALARNASFERAFLSARNKLGLMGSTRDWIALQLFARDRGADDGMDERASATRTAGPPTAHPPPSRWEYRLDRTPQWGPFKTLCIDSRDSVMVLLFGHVSQDVDLFCGRVQRYLVRECQERPHRVCRLRFRQERNTPVVAEDWDERLCEAAQNGTFDPLKALREMTRERPAVLILGDSPLHDLSADETEALVDFLRESLPRYLHRLTRPFHPVRVLIPIAHRQAPGDGLDDALVNTVHDALIEARQPGLVIAMLEELTFPKWSEVAWQLVTEIGPASKALLADFQAAYNRLASAPPEQQNFNKLARAISAVLARKLPHSR